MKRLHPIYHCSSNQPGSRTDIERLLPISPDDVDPEDLIDTLSEPPHFLERLAPVRTQIGEEVIRGKNWTDLMIRTYRVYGRMWSRLMVFLHATLRESFQEKGMVPFLSLCIDPDTLHRIIENDYEAGENTYGSLMQLFSQGALSPCATAPFGLLLPLLDSDFDRRLAIRAGLRFYHRIVRRYYEHVSHVHDEHEFVLLFWLPEGAYSKETLDILYEEFMAYAREKGYRSPHLALLVDNVQVANRDNDVLMKSWNVLASNNGRNGSVSVVCRDKAFSDWVSYSTPSVKKLLDRTIAKMDSDLNARNVSYCWSHFEDLEALSLSPKSAGNFEQKILKLTELGYMSVAPDVYVRRKLNGKFGRAPHEPQSVSLLDGTAGGGWSEESFTLSRWQGVVSNNGGGPKVEPPRPFVRFTRDGEVQESGSQCWKIAWNEARRRVFQWIRGNPRTLKGGVLEVLSSLIPAQRTLEIRQRNVEAFLADYAYVYWREHFIQHDLSEADINLSELTRHALFKGSRRKPTAKECAIAGTAAQAYYFALDAHKAADTRQANFDQRALYQNAVMLTLALCNLMYAYRWTRRRSLEAATLKLLREELIDFGKAYRRFRLFQYGVTEKEWQAATASHIEDSKDNCVTRAARRTAARHLRPLGYRREFTRADETLTTNVGHIWNSEVHNLNYWWENHLFCGMREE
ncbi:MAG: hypothetical protein NTW86_03595 [Candidatus Sumerlaeota bacterium]|nr:hypothetical protein [Candidatus Sumerlaeota bacterium]